MRQGRPTGRCRILLLVPLLLGFAAACMPLDAGTPSAPASAIPEYAPSGRIRPPASSECKSVLVVGDSLLGQAQEQVKSVFGDRGYCAHVDVYGIPGSAPAGQLKVFALEVPGPWTQLLRQFLDEKHYDAVVAWFQGNTGSVTTEQNMQDSYAMLEVAREHGVPMWWTLPPLGAALGCNWSSPYSLDGYERYRAFVFNELVPNTGVKTINGNVLTPLAGPTQEGPDGYTNEVRLPNGKAALVRDADCLHLAGRGADLYARELLYALQGLWGRGTPEWGRWSGSGGGIWGPGKLVDGRGSRGF